MRRPLPSVKLEEPSRAASAAARRRGRLPPQSGGEPSSSATVGETRGAGRRGRARFAQPVHAKRHGGDGRPKLALAAAASLILWPSPCRRSSRRGFALSACEPRGNLASSRANFACSLLAGYHVEFPVSGRRVDAHAEPAASPSLLVDAGGLVRRPAADAHLVARADALGQRQRRRLAVRGVARGGDARRVVHAARPALGPRAEAPPLGPGEAVGESVRRGRRPPRPAPLVPLARPPRAPAAEPALPARRALRRRAARKPPRRDRAPLSRRRRHDSALQAAAALRVGGGPAAVGARPRGAHRAARRLAPRAARRRRSRGSG